VQNYLFLGLIYLASGDNCRVADKRNMDLALNVGPPAFRGKNCTISTTFSADG
jgi:hypothetical protein